MKLDIRSAFLVSSRNKEGCVFVLFQLFLPRDGRGRGGVGGRRENMPAQHATMTIPKCIQRSLGRLWTESFTTNAPKKPVKLPMLFATTAMDVAVPSRVLETTMPTEVCTLPCDKWPDRSVADLSKVQCKGSCTKEADRFDQGVNTRVGSAPAPQRLFPGILTTARSGAVRFFSSPTTW